MNGAARAYAARHWLAWANGTAGLFVGLPFLAPILLATGHTEAANIIYAAYGVVCHQWAFRSYFVLGARPTYGIEELGTIIGSERAFAFLGDQELGYKVAFCERDVAIYLAVLLGGVAFVLLRDRISPLGPAGYLALTLPMALDGFSQLFGWRESTVELRTLTGLLFGLGSVWLAYPRVDSILRPRRASKRAASPSGEIGRVPAHPGATGK